MSLLPNLKSKIILSFTFFIEFKAAAIIQYLFSVYLIPIQAMIITVCVWYYDTKLCQFLSFLKILDFSF